MDCALQLRLEIGFKTNCGYNRGKTGREHGLTISCGVHTHSNKSVSTGKMYSSKLAREMCAERGNSTKVPTWAPSDTGLTGE